MLITRKLASSGRLRFLTTLSIIAVLHFACALVLYFSFVHQGHLVVPYSAPGTRPFDWLYLFGHWDSGWYVGIASAWYPNQFAAVWAFFPLYPLLIRALASLGVDLWLSAFLIATACGLVSIPVFQLIAEPYMDRRRAMASAVLYFLLPWVFVFTAVSYSEPVYLLLTLLTWYFHSKSRNTLSSIAAALASVTRSYGILILLPLVFDFVRRREYRKLVYATPAAFALSAWLAYASVLTGKFLAPLEAESFWQYGVNITFQVNLEKLMLGNISVLSNLIPYYRILIAGVLFLSLLFLLSVKVYRYEPALAVYSAVSTIIITAVGAFPAYLSVPRFLSFLFPIGLPLHTRRTSILLILGGLLLILDYVGWYAFLTNIFIFH